MDGGSRDGVGAAENRGVTYTIVVSPKTTSTATAGLVTRVPVAVPVTRRPAPVVRSRSIRHPPVFGNE